MANQQISKDERSLGELFSSLAGETGKLVRQEVALAQTEFTQKAARIGRNVGYLAVGGAVGYAGLLGVLTAVIALLTYVIPLWLAALIVGVVVGLVAYVMITAALKALKETELTPRQTVETLKEDAQWLKNQVS